MIKKLFSFTCLILVLCSLLGSFGCSLLFPEPEATPEPTPEITEKPVITNTPQVFEFSATTTETPVPVTPSPTPEPTEVPESFADYAPTIKMSYEELVGSTDDMDKSVKDVLKDGLPDPSTYYVIVDKYWQVVMVYRRKGSGDYGEPDYDQPVRFMLCSTGNPKTQYGHETQSGRFKIDRPRERFYQFVNLEAAQYLTCIHSRTYFHSVLYKKKGDLNTLLKDSYDNLGSKASHACVRLTVPDARWIFYNIAEGTSCEVREGSKNDERTKEIRDQLVLPPSRNAVKLDPKEYPWTDNWSVEEVAHDVQFKYMRPRMPEGYDSAGNKIEGYDEDKKKKDDSKKEDSSSSTVVDVDTGSHESSGGGDDGLPIIE